jgi:hypothetical protein
MRHALAGALQLGRAPVESPLGRLDQDAFVSAPASALLTLSDGGPDQRFVKTIPGVFATATLSADVMIVEPPATLPETVWLLDLVIIVGELNWHFGLQHSRGALEVVQAHFGEPDGGYSYKFEKVAGAPQVGVWKHVSMQIRTASNELRPHGVVLLDTQSLFDTDLVEAWPPGRLEINAGLFTNYAAAGHWIVRVDNVTLDAQ